MEQPAFKSRGSGYVRFNAVTITGNGFIDKYQTGGEVVVDDLTLLPSPGDNMRFAGITGTAAVIGQRPAGQRLRLTSLVDPPVFPDSRKHSQASEFLIAEYILRKPDFSDSGLPLATGTI